MKKNYHTGPKCISPKTKVTAWGKDSSFWAVWRINKSWNLYPTKRAMTGSKELSKQQRSWLQICNKAHLVYGRQALNSEKKKSVQIPSYISSDENVTGIHPERRQMLLPKMLRFQRLLRRTLDEAPARLCAGITASFKATRWQYTPTLIFPLPSSYSSHKNSKRTETLFLFISQPILKADMV